MEKKTEQYLKFERLISDLSALFVNLSPEQVHCEIENGLKKILDFFQVDRCGLLLSSLQSDTWQVTHAAFADGIATVPVKTDLPIALYPWASKKLMEQRELVIFSKLDELPAEAHIDKQTYREWGIRSNAAFPISVNLNDYYIFSLDAVRSERVWPEEYIPRLRLLGEIFVNALVRAQSRLQIEEQITFEQFLRSLSSRFIGVSPEHLDQPIVSSLQSIAEFYDVDCIILCQMADDKSQLTITHSWAAPGFKITADVISNTTVPWILQKLMRGEPVVWGRLDDLPKEAAQDKKYLQEINYQSSIYMPLQSGEKLLGCAFLVSLSRQRTWPDKMLRSLQPMVKMLSSELARKRDYLRHGDRQI